MSEDLKKNCQACAHCYMEPDDMNFVCGHPDTPRPWGIYVHRATEEKGHCGPELKKFTQHPLRNSNGTLKGASP